MNTDQTKRPVGRPRRIVTPSEQDRRITSATERESLNQFVKDHKEDHQEDAFHYANKPNDQEIAGIKRIERTLREGEPEPLSQFKKVALEKESKELESQLRKLLVPRSELGLKQSPDPRFRKAVNEMVRSEMGSNCQGLVNRWKNIMRQIDPDDPSISNVENIRPESR